MAMGIPFDAQAKRRYVAVLCKRPGRQLAAHEIGVSWGTVKKHLKEDHNFLMAVEEAENRIIEAIESTLIDMALDENLGAIKEVLHNMRPDRWRDQQVLRHEHTGAGGGPIQIAQGHTIALVNVLTNPELREGAINLAMDMPTTDELDAEYAELADDD